jgi:hypothetical protein
VVCACRDEAKAQHAATSINACVQLFRSCSCRALLIEFQLKHIPQPTNQHNTTQHTRRLDRLRQQQLEQEKDPQEGGDAALVTIGRAEAAPAPLDLGSLKSVRAFAGAYHRSGRPLHVLVGDEGLRCVGISS